MMNVHSVEKVSCFSVPFYETEEMEGGNEMLVKLWGF